ncbi:MAG TPA: hypothetical protein VNR62_05325, partial [Cellulomonas sp.]|nr:hypothetical protein [Cellulomonas sp.]
VKASGTTTVTATGDNGLTASTTVQVTGVSTSVTVAGHAQPRAALAFTGAGFQAGETVAVTLSGASTTVTAAADGSVTGTIGAPASSGVFELKAVGGTSRATATVPVTVDAAADPAIAAPTRATLGSVLTVAGSSFAPGSTVTVSLGSSALTTARADARGAFTVKATVPLRADLLGRVQLYARGTDAAGSAVTVTRPVTVSKAAATLGAPTLSRTSTVYGSAKQVTLTTVVTGATSGKVTFKNGSTVLGTASIGKSGSGYRATVKLAKKLPAGTYAKITASVAATSTSSAAVSPVAKKLTVVKATPSSVKVSGKAFAKKTHPKVSVSVGKLSNGTYPVGKVKVYVNGKVVKTVTLKSSAHGKVTVTLPKASATIKVKATFVPSDTKNVSSKTSSTVKITTKR